MFIRSIIALQLTGCACVDATSPDPPIAARAKLVLLALCLLGNALLYGSLYRSDPGWVTAKAQAGGDGPAGLATGPPAPPCVWCTLPGPVRRRHDHNTGADVHSYWLCVHTFVVS
jgi:hypothetical protein